MTADITWCTIVLIYLHEQFITCSKIFTKVEKIYIKTS